MTTEITSIGFALDPTNIPCFLLDWEVTKKCNLDCTYCEIGIDGGHDNSTRHPPLAGCLETIDFMYEYVDLYMQYKKPSQRKVVLNVYGGESLLHPHILAILQACHEKYTKYNTKWHLTIACTTNGIIKTDIFKQIVPLVDRFTMSFHADSLAEQRQVYFDNLLELKESNSKFNAVIMLHNTQWDISMQAIEFCKDNGIDYVAKPVDQIDAIEWRYNDSQLDYLKQYWGSHAELTADKNIVQQGRPCCGRRKLSINGDLKSCERFIPRQGFEGWSCSVNWFFLFVQQLTGNVYTNKDCKMSTNGEVGPLGNIQNASDILDTLRTQLETSTMPIIQCKKKTCLCGFCAPKAVTREDFIELITRNVPTNVFKK